MTDPGHCPDGFVTRNNRLMKYVEETFVENLRGEGDWVETRSVAYTYYRTGHASNITIKDYSSPVYRDLALYYDLQGRLVYALWDSWEIEDDEPVNYARDRAVEFRYENADARARYMLRELDPDELPDIVPLASPLGQWVEYSGSSPFLDATYTHEDDESYEVTREYDPLGLERVAGTDDELNLHGDLIGSTIAGTDDAEAVAGRVVYTAFGEPVGTPTLTGTRYRYAGAWGYEDGLLSLEGAGGTQPIVLLHLGERWYEPAIGRFIQRDPIGLMGGRNVYLYVDGDPLSHLDPTGLLTFREFSDGDTVVHKWIARNLWNRIFSDDYLSRMSDGEMYAWGIGSGVVGGVCVYAGGGLVARLALNSFGRAGHIQVHGAHHPFGSLGKLPHIQITRWTPGVSNSHKITRIPLPPGFNFPIW